MTPGLVLDFLLRTGPHGDRYLPWSRGLNLRKLRRSTHGIDLGPLEPRAMRRGWPRRPLPKVQLAPAQLLADVPRFGAWLDATGHRLVLIGRRHLRSNNSWLHNIKSLTKGPDRSQLLMHPQDAAEHQLVDGDEARVTSERGSVTCRLRFTTDVMKGVVSLPHGWGHQLAHGSLRIASTLAGVNVNELTDDARIDPLSGNAALNGEPVKVSRAT